MQVSNKDSEAINDDYEEFLQELETDKEMRTKVNLYKKKVDVKPKKKKNIVPVTQQVTNKMDEDEDNWEDIDDEEAIKLEELLEELDLENDEDLCRENLKVFSPTEAAIIPKIELVTSGFDLADVDLNEFKFK